MSVSRKMMSSVAGALVALVVGAGAARAQNQISKPFTGAKVNAGTVTHTMQNGKHVLTLSGDAIMSIYGPGFAVGGGWVAIVGAACALNAFVGLGELILMVKRPALNLVNSSIAIAR